MTNILANRIILFMLATLLVCVGILAVPAGAHASSIKDKIVGAQGGGGLSQIEQDVDNSANSVIKTARRIFVSLTVVFGLWLGVLYFRAGFSPDALRDTKGKIGLFLLFLICSFWTEQILGLLFKLLGIDLTDL